MFIDLLRDTAILFYFLAPLFSYFLIVAGLRDTTAADF